MPQSSAALRQKAQILRFLRNPTATLPDALRAHSQRPLRARKPFTCAHGSCLAVASRDESLWVLVRDPTGQETWVPQARALAPDQCRAWARDGFG